MRITTLITSRWRSGKSQTAAAAGLLCLVSILLLVPFATKAFHIDDPLNLWAAKQIHSHPADFYGFEVNWAGENLPMSYFNQNPPTVPYFVAWAALFLGWSERALHLAFLIPAVAVALGTYRLALRFCGAPLIAGLIAVSTPVFIVSGTNIMCDMMMSAFWVWAMICWVNGIDRDNCWQFLAASLLIVLCGLTKYSGISLIPLLLVYSLVSKRTLRSWGVFLLLPVVILAGYEWLTIIKYGHGLLSQAVNYAPQKRVFEGISFPAKLITGIVFTGGSFSTVLFYLPWLWSRRIAILSLVFAAVLSLSLSWIGGLGRLALQDEHGTHWSLILQLVLWCIVGLQVAGLAVVDLWKQRSPDSLLLFLWVMGTFVFAVLINWTINVRSLLPMLPAVSILLARRLSLTFDVTPSRLWKHAGTLVPAICLSLLVSWADYTLANSARTAANQIHSLYRDRSGKVWFEGHWGFQYYMELAGAKAYDLKKPQLAAGDVLVIPTNNTNINIPMTREEWQRVSPALQLQPFRWLTTMNPALGAGFYADLAGPLPFALGVVPPEEYYCLSVTKR